MTRCSLYRQCKYYNINNYTCNIQQDKTVCAYYKRMLGILLMVVICVLSLPLVMSVTDEEQYQSSIPINLQFTCTLNSAIPSPSTTFNISIYYPNGTILLNNVATTAQGQGSFNYSVTFPANGLYKVKMFCTNTTYSFADEGSYLITTTGTTISPVQISMYIFFLLLCLILTFFSFRLIKNNPVSKNTVKYSELYQMKKRNEFVFILQC